MDRKRARPLRLGALPAAAGLLAALLVAVTAPPVSARPAAGMDPGKLYWIFYKEDIERINHFDPSIVQQLAAGPGTYALTRSAHGPRLPAGVIPVENFFSAASIQQAISSGQIFPGVQAVAEDPEDWRATPMPERLTPIRYMERFAASASARGLMPILVPARDLMRVKDAACGQTPSQTISQAYVSCGIPQAAAGARMFVIQSAAVETNLPALRQLIAQASAQARKANPKVIVLATLSAAPNGTAVPTSALTAAAKAMMPYVEGFEMNSEPENDHEVVSFFHALGLP